MARHDDWLRVIGSFVLVRGDNTQSVNVQAIFADPIMQVHNFGFEITVAYYCSNPLTYNQDSPTRELGIYRPDNSSTFWFPLLAACY